MHGGKNSQLVDDFSPKTSKRSTSATAFSLDNTEKKNCLTVVTSGEFIGYAHNGSSVKRPLIFILVIAHVVNVNLSKEFHRMCTECELADISSTGRKYTFIHGCTNSDLTEQELSDENSNVWRLLILPLSWHHHWTTSLAIFWKSSSLFYESWNWWTTSRNDNVQHCNWTVAHVIMWRCSIERVVENNDWIHNTQQSFFFAFTLQSTYAIPFHIFWT